jgi:hypothetical protein
MSARPRSSSSQPQIFRVQARNNTKKEEDDRSERSFMSIPKDRKMRAYGSNLGPNTMKKLRMVSRNVNKQSIMTGNTTRSVVSYNKT